jgi:hypothetical protein
LGVVAGYFDTLPLKTGRNGRIEEAALRPYQLLCLSQRRLRCRDGRIGLERLLDQCVERRRLEQLPPFERDIAAADQALRLAAMNRRRGARSGKGVGAYPALAGASGW